MEYFIIYDKMTGTEIMRGSGSEGISSSQRLMATMGTIVVSQSSYGLSTLGDIPLTEIQGALWEQVKAYRDALIDGGVDTPSGLVDSDAAARLNIAGAMQAAILANTQGTAYSACWTLKNNSVVELDADAMIDIGLAVTQHGNACHDRARSLRASIYTATSPIEALQIDISADWP